MSNPLTIEELKELKVGEWVWLVHTRFSWLDGEYVLVENNCVVTMESDEYPFDDYGTDWLAYKNKEQAEGKDEQIKFTLDGCDISFTATAPADMTVEQLVKQASRIKPDWCACGICSADENDEVEIVFDYNDVKKANDDVSCTIKEEFIK